MPSSAITSAKFCRNRKCLCMACRKSQRDERQNGGRQYNWNSQSIRPCRFLFAQKNFVAVKMDETLYGYISWCILWSDSMPNSRRYIFGDPVIAHEVSISVLIETRPIRQDWGLLLVLGVRPLSLALTSKQILSQGINFRVPNLEYYATYFVKYSGITMS